MVQPRHEPIPSVVEFPVGEVAARPDLTNFDFSGAPLYQTADQEAFPAEQLTEPRTIMRSWGQQDMQPGDWVVYKRSRTDGSVKESGVMQVAFDATYVDLGNGLYIKDAYIRAVRIDHDYMFFGPDSDRVPELAPAGTYLTLNLDRNRQPIMKDGKRDIFFYTARDMEGYRLVEDPDAQAQRAA